MNDDAHYELMVLDLVNAMRRVRSAEAELGFCTKQRDSVLHSAEKLLAEFPVGTRVDTSFLGDPPYGAAPDNHRGGGFHVVDDSIWRPIETAPRDRWVYLWQPDVANSWADRGALYTSRVARWNDEEGTFLTLDGDYVRGATHWTELLPPPSAGG